MREPCGEVAGPQIARLTLASGQHNVRRQHGRCDDFPLDNSWASSCSARGSFRRGCDGSRAPFRCRRNLIWCVRSGAVARHRAARCIRGNTAFAYCVDSRRPGGRSRTWPRRSRPGDEIPGAWHDFSPADQSNHRTPALRHSCGGHRRPRGHQKSRPDGNQSHRLFRDSLDDRNFYWPCRNQHQPRRRGNSDAGVSIGKCPGCSAAHGDRSDSQRVSGKHCKVRGRGTGAASRRVQHSFWDRAGDGAGSQNESP